MTENEGWVSVGIDHDTAYFGTESLRRRWAELKKDSFHGERNDTIPPKKGRQ